ncbi:hypothetical protein [Myxococcus xanthus]|uniref:hypothetical protein n=1 Tax=Myxococcus xanthus TaxID=34 RepID=UPI0021E52835|nr:hypothetical protein [Myxococcus xanthus]UYI17162.1 hypothetical protein N3T43_12850 [Myxococcus xanthus]
MFQEQLSPQSQQMFGESFKSGSSKPFASRLSPRLRTGSAARCVSAGEAIRHAMFERGRGMPQGYGMMPQGYGMPEPERIADALCSRLSETLRERIASVVHERIRDGIRERLAECVRAALFEQWQMSSHGFGAPDTERLAGRCAPACWSPCASASTPPRMTACARPCASGWRTRCAR